MNIKIGCFSSVVVACLALSACGGSSGGGTSNPGGDNGGGIVDVYDGATSVASVSTDNQEDIAVAASLGARQAIASGGGDNLPVDFQAKTGSSDSAGMTITSHVQQILDDSLVRIADHYFQSQLPTGYVRETACSDGGNIVENFPGIESPESEPPASGSGTLTFNNCDIGTITTDGAFEIIWSGGYNANLDAFRDIEAVFDLTVSFDGQTESVQGRIVCSDFAETCTLAQYFIGGDTEYQITNVSAFETSSGYVISARVYHEDLGYVDISGNNLTVCENGNIGTGTISVTDSTSTAVLTIDFISCDQFVVTYEGVATEYDQ